MEDPPFIGDWHFVKKLGAGGFGLVKLWQNSKTGQKIGTTEKNLLIISCTMKKNSINSFFWYLKVTCFRNVVVFNCRNYL